MKNTETQLPGSMQRMVRWLVRCKHPAARLAVVREQTVSRLNDDFEKVTYHLFCQKCGEAFDITHAMTPELKTPAAVTATAQAALAAPPCCACCSATRRSQKAITAFLASVTDLSSNYVGGVESLDLEDALKECRAALDKHNVKVSDHADSERGA